MAAEALVLPRESALHSRACRVAFGGGPGLEAQMWES